MQSMHMSAPGRKLLEDLEGRRHRIYDDKTGAVWDGKSTPRGALTIGVGHVLTAQERMSGAYLDGIDDPTIDRLLSRDLVPREQLVCARVRPELGQHRFDALTMLVFNWGHVPSELLGMINSGLTDEDVVKRAWMSHTRANGDPDALRLRRSRELALWLTPDPEQAVDVTEVLARVYKTSADLVAAELAPHRTD